MDRKIASAVLRYRTLFLVVITLLTVFFGWRATHLKLSYDFEKLLPRNHPYVKTYKEFQETFGGANLITIEVAVKQGDIFNYETLSKIRRVSDEIQFVPGIDRYKVISIGAKKIKETKATAWGMEKTPLLWPDVPQSPDRIQDLRRACMSDDSIYGILVSVDGKAALIMADVYEKGVDYQRIYKEIRRITDREVDPNTTVHVCGEPIVVGEVIKAMPKIIWIFGFSMVLVLGLLYLHFMNLRIPFLHITVSGATTLWGLGMMEILHFTLNPMTTIVPFLLMVISISHANQLIIRYVEKSALRGQGGIEAAEEALGEILKPGVAALGTNLAGFSVLAIIPIGAIQELAVTASIGMCCAVLRDLTLLPILLSRMKNLGGHHNSKHFVGGLFEKAMTRISHSIFNKTERTLSLGIMIALFGSGLYFARHMDIGSLHPGSPLFWENSRYNLDSKKINEDFYGTDAMSVVVQGEKGVLRDPALLSLMESYQRFITGIPKVGGAISLVDIVKNVNQKVHEDDPVWFVIPPTPKELGGAYQLFYNGADPGDFDIFGTGELDSANIRVFFKDHTASTIRVALDETKRFFVRNPPPGKAQIRLAGGLIGVLGAIGEVLEKYHLEATVLSFVVICLVVYLTFRSAMAVALICVPLGMVSVMSFAFMKLCRIELDINTLPIAALGMGLCVDYGIYLYGKIRSETARGGEFREVLDRAMVSCGSAVIVTGTTFTLGVIPWVFSDLRFQATMGLLLAFLFIMNMIISILVLPILIDIVKPKDIFSSLKEKNRGLMASDRAVNPAVMDESTAGGA